MIVYTIIVGAVVRSVAAPVVPERETTPAPPAIVCNARGNVFMASLVIYTSGEKESFQLETNENTAKQGRSYKQ